MKEHIQNNANLCNTLTEQTTDSEEEIKANLQDKKCKMLYTKTFQILYHKETNYLKRHMAQQSRYGRSKNKGTFGHYYYYRYVLTKEDIAIARAKSKFALYD